MKSTGHGSNVAPNSLCQKEQGGRSGRACWTDFSEHNFRMSCAEPQASSWQFSLKMEWFVWNHCVREEAVPVHWHNSCCGQILRVNLSALSKATGPSIQISPNLQLTSGENVTLLNKFWGRYIYIYFFFLNGFSRWGFSNSEDPAGIKGVHPHAQLPWRFSYWPSVPVFSLLLMIHLKEYILLPSNPHGTMNLK